MPVPTYVRWVARPTAPTACECNGRLISDRGGGSGVTGGPSYRPRTVLRPPRRSASAPTERRRSHAAAPVAIVLVIVGLALGTYSILIPGFLGVVLFGAAVSFLSTRLNPLSVGFYLPVKPSWAAIGVVALGALVLFATVWVYWTHGIASVLPGHAPRW